MPAQVKLTPLQGDLPADTLVFDERTTCIMGRGRECHPGLVIHDHTGTVSRHHCLLDINPPDIRVRDLGSLEGTYVNGVLIGKRAAHQSAAEGASLKLPERDLRDGDLIRIKDTIIRVNISVPRRCQRCSVDLPDDTASASAALQLCPACQRQASKLPAPATNPTCCKNCGRDVSAEVRSRAAGELVCAKCKQNVDGLLQTALLTAQAGNPDLQPMAGYRALRRLGKGGMGAVYLAQHERTQQFAAIKVMLPEVAAEARSREMFLREMRNSQALQHPNVVRLFASGCFQGVYFGVLEYCDGGDVAALVRSRGGKLPLSEAIGIVLPALEGLQYAHQATIPEVKRADGSVGQGRGLVHRDIKLENLFLHGSGAARTVKVGDYGLSKAFDAAGLSGQTLTGETAGTPLFMPRQQLLKYKYAQPDVDVWAIAACLYYMITGQVPRNFSPDKDAWLTVLTTAPVPIRQRDAAVPGRLAELLDSALDDSKGLRFSSAAALKSALESAI